MATGGKRPAPARVVFVSGAPGAGTSTVAEALLELKLDALVFDADWLVEPASNLAGRDLTLGETSDLRPLYDRLWTAIATMVVWNGGPVVLLTVMDPRSRPAMPWQGAPAWCLRDCDDETRIARLEARGWSGTEVADALQDARALGEQIEFVIDTSGTTPRDAAMSVASWLRTQLHNSLPVSRPVRGAFSRDAMGVGAVGP